MANPRLTEERMQQAYRTSFDLSNCANEPIQYIGLLQPHACLLAIDPADLQIRISSDNTEQILGKHHQQLLDAPLSTLFDQDSISVLRRGWDDLPTTEANPHLIYLHVDDKLVSLRVIPRKTEHYLLVEIEPVAGNFFGTATQRKLGSVVSELQQLVDYTTLFSQMARLLRDVTGYDRVMVYRFDVDYNGAVIAEAKRDDLEPLLGLRYPATDIPPQARELYKQNKVRLLANVACEQAQLIRSSAADADLNLDLATVDARGLSPIHQEYLQNMGVDATMSVAIMLHGKLWGLFALHHYSPRYLDYEMRSFTRFLGEVFSGHLSLQEASRFREHLLEVNLVRSALGERMILADSLSEALLHGEPNVLDLIPGCCGAAVGIDDKLELRGESPPREVIQELIAWAHNRSEEKLLFTTDRLCEQFEPVADMHHCTAGVLLLWTNYAQRECIIWFRPEIIHSINWGGKPEKPAVTTADGNVRLSPRRSFLKYTETVRGRSQPWDKADEDSALALRSHIKDVVMHKYQQVQRINSELASAYKEMESFSYTVSHDLRAPLRGISAYSEILLEDYEDVMNAEGKDMLLTIQRLTTRMNGFIDDLLQISKIGMSTLNRVRCDLAELAHATLADLKATHPKNTIEFSCAADDYTIFADTTLVQILLRNLISNALKYSSHQPVIKLELQVKPSKSFEKVFAISDNGIGFEQEHAERAFEMFTRLSSSAAVEGTGVGLALVKKVAERHGGKVWAKSSPGNGATFYFTLASS